MKSLTVYAATLAAATLVAVAAQAQTGDTMRLGVGSTTGANAAHSAPTVTLLGKPETKADTQEVFHRYARGYYHGAYGYGYRPWIGHYHAYARPYLWGSYYSPYAFYRPYYYGYSYFPSIAYSFSYYSPISTRVVASAGAASVPVVPYASAPAYADPVNPMTGTEMLPTPRSGDTFRYDGGPMRPVPMPDSSQPMPITPPIPRVNVPAINRVKAPAAPPKIAYPAYGEELPKPRPVSPSPIVVKYAGQK